MMTDDLNEKGIAMNTDYEERMSVSGAEATLEREEDILNEMADRAGIHGSHDEHCSEDQLCRACWIAHYSTRLHAAIRRKHAEDDLEALCAYELEQHEKMLRYDKEHPEETASNEEEEPVF